MPLFFMEVKSNAIVFCRGRLDVCKGKSNANIFAKQDSVIGCFMKYKTSDYIFV